MSLALIALVAATFLGRFGVAVGLILGSLIEVVGVLVLARAAISGAYRELGTPRTGEQYVVQGRLLNDPFASTGPPFTEQEESNARMFDDLQKAGWGNDVSLWMVRTRAVRGMLLLLLGIATLAAANVLALSL